MLDKLNLIHEIFSICKKNFSTNSELLLNDLSTFFTLCKNIYIRYLLFSTYMYSKKQMLQFRHFVTIIFSEALQ